MESCSSLHSVMPVPISSPFRKSLSCRPFRRTRKGRGPLLSPFTAVPLSTLSPLFTVRATTTLISCLWLKPLNNAPPLFQRNKPGKVNTLNVKPEFLFSPSSAVETDRQRKDALRLKVGLKTLYFLFSISFFFLFFTWNESSSMNTIWWGWRAYGVVDMIKLSQCKRTSHRSASMCPEPRS